MNPSWRTGARFCEQLEQKVTGGLVRLSQWPSHDGPIRLLHLVARLAEVGAHGVHVGLDREHLLFE